MRTSPTLSRRRGQNGQSLVEFTLIIPVFLLILFGMIEFGDGSALLREQAFHASPFGYDESTKLRWSVEPRGTGPAPGEYVHTSWRPWSFAPVVGLAS